MLSFHVVEGGKAIQICCDREGMGVLTAALANVGSGGPSHVHLRGVSAGGAELSELSPFGEPAVAEVIIDYNPMD